MFFGLPDPDSLLRDPDPDPSIIKQNSKKTLDSYCFMTSLDFLSLKKDVNVPAKSNKQKNLFFLLVFFGALKVNDEIAGSGSISQRHGSVDPGIRIHTKMSWIRNTVLKPKIDDRNEPALEHEHAVPDQGRGTGHPLSHRLRQGLLRARRYDEARKTGFSAEISKFRPPVYLKKGPIK
jgi:hypothetical protein